MTEDECKKYADSNADTSWGGVLNIEGEIPGCYAQPIQTKFITIQTIASKAKCSLGSRACIKKSEEYPGFDDFGEDVDLPEDMEGEEPNIDPDMPNPKELQSRFDNFEKIKCILKIIILFRQEIYMIC